MRLPELTIHIGEQRERRAAKSRRTILANKTLKNKNIQE